MKLRNKKTGKIIQSACIGIFKHQSSGNCERIDTEARSLEKVLEVWEDYTPQEPLIKDENIRKAVRLWAYINDIETATYDEIHHDRGLNVFFFEDPEEENAIIQFYGWMPKFEEGKDYSITELCGEEEDEN